MKASPSPLGFLYLAVWLALLTGACGAPSLTVKLDDDDAKARPLTHVEGKAVFTDLGGGKTRVEVQVSLGTPANPDMPANLHSGACPDVGAVAYPLTNVKNGKSTTEINADFKQFTGGGHAINLQKSPQETTVYVSCGNIKGAAVPGAPKGG